MSRVAGPVCGGGRVTEKCRKAGDARQREIFPATGSQGNELTAGFGSAVKVHVEPSLPNRDTRHVLKRI
jgi:hypothetical protein